MQQHMMHAIDMVCLVFLTCQRKQYIIIDTAYDAMVHKLVSMKAYQSFGADTQLFQSDDGQ